MSRSASVLRGTLSLLVCHVAVCRVYVLVRHPAKSQRDDSKVYQRRFGKENDEPLKRILERTQWYWDHSGVPPHVRESFRKVLQCRTRALGAEVFASENGELIVYHTCKSRA